MESLYFIAVVPPPDIREAITRIKEEIRDRYGSGHALRSPPHITLHMPFKWKDKEIDALKKTLKKVADPISSFEIQLRDFACFKPRVIYVDVVGNEDLRQLQQKVVSSMRSLGILNADYKNRAFQPHMTVAFRDLRKSRFFEAWKEFKDRKVSYEFEAKQVCLLKHDGKKWHIFESFEMQDKVSGS